MGEKILILNLPKVSLEEMIPRYNLKYKDLSDIFGKVEVNNYDSVLLISDLDYEKSFEYINLIGIYSETQIRKDIPCILFKYLSRREIQNIITSEDKVKYIDISNKLDSKNIENEDLDLYMKLIGVNIIDFNKKKYYNIFKKSGIKKILNFIK